MPRTKEENQRIHEEQRIRILKAAREVFARKGWTATMADIAQAAKVSQGLAYRYFANKESIYQELVQRAIEASSLHSNLNMSGTPMERLHSLLAKVLNFKTERVEFYQISVQILRDDSSSKELRDMVRSQAQSFRSTVKQLIIEGQAMGEIVEGDPEQLVIALLACIHGLSNIALRGNARLKEHFPDAGIVLRMLRP